MRFCRDRVGQRVGDGECWTLADLAVKHAGGDPALGTNFGQEVSPAMARPGDVLQFASCRFELPFGGQMSAGFPDHTGTRSGTPRHAELTPPRCPRANAAVVTDWPSPEGDIPVLEQNPLPVHDGSYNLRYLTSGTVKVYRVLPPAAS